MVRKDKPSRASSVAKKSAKAPTQTRDDATKNSPVAVELERLRAILRSFLALSAEASPNDSPALSILEGRLLRAMRLLWDGAEVAREQGSSKLVFTVTPALLRGLDIKKSRKPAPPTEP